MVEEVIDKVKWTPAAQATFNNIVQYLVKEWSEKEVQQFINNISIFLSALKRHPEMCRPSIKKKHVRIGILNKHTQLVYHYKPGAKQIEILLFWNFRQNPARFKY